MWVIHLIKDSTFCGEHNIMVKLPRSHKLDRQSKHKNRTLKEIKKSELC